MPLSDDTVRLARPDLTRETLIAELRALRPEFEAAGISRMRLFGSRARGDHRPDSDVDLLIDVFPGRKFSLLDVIGVIHLIEDCLRLEGNVFMNRDLSPEFRAEADRDGVHIFG